MDSRRFGRHYTSRDYTLARTKEVYSTYYDVKYPGHERSAGRPLRLSPIYSRLTELGAAFGEKSGWERANWLEPNGTLGDTSLRPHGWAGRLWSPAIGVEHAACREAAAIFDFTSFAKIEVRGRGAAEFLEGLADNRVARAVGALTYTQMLNERGGIECDFTITRLGERRFRVITGTAFGMHDLSWIRDHAPSDGSVEVEDVTSAYACVGLWGPNARSILQRLTPDDIGNDAFPFMTARELAVGSVPCGCSSRRRSIACGRRRSPPPSWPPSWRTTTSRGRDGCSMSAAGRGRTRPTSGMPSTSGSTPPKLFPWKNTPPLAPRSWKPY